MHLVQTRLPASLSEDALQQLDPAFDGLSVGYYVTQITPDDPHSAWQAHWIMSTAPAQDTLSMRLREHAALCGLTLPDRLTWQIDPIDPDRDWLAESYQGFQPFSVGPFYLYGSHEQRPEPPAGSYAMEIDAATAFGSGEHPTTAGCLELMADLQQDGLRPASVLDVGCGSGILSIAAFKLWECPVLAVDIDPESEVVTRRHAAANGVPVDQTRGLSALTGDGYRHPDIRRHGPYDLVLANILAGALIDMAADAAGSVAPGGILILSGILAEQTEDVIAAHTARGLTHLRTLKKGEWTALSLQRPA